MTARDTALTVLIACRKDGAWSDGALKKQIAADRLDRRDAALASRLCFGVLQNRMLLDHWIDRFTRGKLQPAVRDILRLAVYQLHFLDKLPQSAVVNEAVEQAKRLANDRAAGLVNAVLRRMLREPELLSLPEELPTRYSHPAELVKLLEDSVGKDRLEALLACHNEIPPTYAQVNTLRASVDNVLQSLSDEGYTAAAHPWLEGCIELTGGSIEQSSAFRNGLLYAQDPAARLAVLAAGLAPDMRVLDCCAAPGGKSFAAAICMADRGEIVSCDLHPHKIALIEKGAARLGFSCIRTGLQNARYLRPDWVGGFDAVLCDVPCSGLGVIRKKPDIRYKELEPLKALPEIQAAILDAQAAYLRAGGVLLYSTCTLLTRENDGVIDGFLARHGDFFCEPFLLPNGLAAPQGRLTLMPSVHGTDGFYICKLRKHT